MRITLTILAAASLLLSACSRDDTKIETALDPALDPTVSSAVVEAPPPSYLPCKDEIGDMQAAKLVERCIAVSPATHPPCNALNTCDTITDEIKRSCDMYGVNDTMPAECAP